MELSSPKIKKCLQGTFRARKIKNIHSEKISYIFSKKRFLIFQKMELSGVKIKKVLIFSQKNFFYILGHGTFLKNFLYFGRELYELKKKKNALWNFFLYFGKWNFLNGTLMFFSFFPFISRGNLQTLKKKNFWYFLQKNVHI